MLDWLMTYLASLQGAISIAMTRRQGLQCAKREGEHGLTQA